MGKTRKSSIRNTQNLLVKSCVQILNRSVCFQTQARTFYTSFQIVFTSSNDRHIYSIMLPKTCCCGRSLGTGTKIIAILTIIFSIVLFSFGLFMSINDNYKNPIAIVLLVWPMVYIVLAVLLLVGVSRKKPFYILPWLTISTIQLIPCPVILIWISVIIGTAGRSTEVVVKVFLGFILGVGIPLTAVGIVFLIVVFSYYKEQRSTAEFTPFVTEERL